jgi:8-oxo-dGTP pyrophosphatase MutT (NUDIX family)
LNLEKRLQNACVLCLQRALQHVHYVALLQNKMVRLRDALGYRDRAACLVLSPLYPGHILLVGSSKDGFKKRCVLPAGGIDLEDLTAADAAKREAREEAGVEGIIYGLPGSKIEDKISIERALALITDKRKLTRTQVFLLLVTREIPLTRDQQDKSEKTVSIKKKEIDKVVEVQQEVEEEEDMREVNIRGREWIPISDAPSRLCEKESQLLCITGALSALRDIISKSDTHTLYPNTILSDKEVIERGLEILIKRNHDLLKEITTTELCIQ